MTHEYHSDYQIRWRNFRRFEDTGWITLKPLTILLGANNSGKSSVVCPLLLLAQTLASTDRDVPLLPHGPMVDLGTYRDFIHNHDVTRDLFFGLRFHLHNSPKKLKAVGAYPPGGMELTLHQGERPESLNISKVELTDVHNRSYLMRKKLRDGKFSLSGAVDGKLMKPVERKAVHSASPMNFLFAPNDLFYTLSTQAKKDGATDATSFSEQFSHYLRVIGFAYSSMRGIFGSLSYVGPLREKLKRYYRVSAELPDTVGSQGEHAAILYRSLSEKIRPKVNPWIKRFEFGEELVVNSLAPELFELAFERNSQQTNVADAGFGASQVLPLIIQAAASPTDSLTIAEQPEIHLNPKLQCELADLFVEMATSGHRVVVETHSEHLIVRLRRLIAEGKISEKHVSLLFVEKSSTGSAIREIPIRGNGVIERVAWPNGFFEDGLREALALASVQSKVVRAK